MKITGRNHIFSIPNKENSINHLTVAKNYSVANKLKFVNFNTKIDRLHYGQNFEKS